MNESSQRRPVKWSWASCALATSLGWTAVATAIPGTPSVLPDIPANARPTVDCVYHFLKANASVRSVDIYAIDGFRSAVEYGFKGRDGKIILTDVMIDVLDGHRYYDLSGPYAGSKEEDLELQAFVTSLDFNSHCRLSPAFDNLYPRPKPRAEWRRIDWPDTSAATRVK